LSSLVHHSFGTRIVLLGICLSAFGGGVLAQEPDPSTGRRRAPSLTGGLEWINSEHPVKLAELRGKSVILDFWTYCCINCLQTLPDLEQLEQAYPNELVVIGVHAPKFFGERDTENIREAVRRHRVEHPVVNDANAVIAKRYGVRGWPTLQVIDPEGYLIASHYGEATFEMLNTFMMRTLPKYRRKGLLDDKPVRFRAADNEVESTPLRFPGKILADGTSEQLFIADSGHNRIVVTSFDGEISEVVGSGERGHRDGAFDEAMFSSPQGMALQDDVLYMADTENHIIRRIDLVSKKVSTLAGTGRRGTTVVVRFSKRPTSQELASPWDLTIQGSWLYIAMAGTHQVWRMSLDGTRLHTYAGSGAEDIVDGQLRPRKAFESGVAAFAQPSGLTVDREYLYVADGEGSSIRAIPFRQSGKAKTVLGTSGLPKAQRLFT
jgi:thiol-disulfide isomerase/thioredoxin